MSDNFTISLRIVEDQENRFDIVVYSSAPNSTFIASNAEMGKPSDIAIEDSSTLHITLNLESKGTVNRLSQLSSRPLIWTLDDIEVDAEIRSVMLHMVMAGSTISTKIVDISSERMGQVPIEDLQKLTDLQRVVEKVGLNETDIILKKLKDVGY